MDGNRFILAANVIPEFSDFLTALKIKNTGLGRQLFKSVYDHIFISSIDLKKEYSRYYCVEYTSIYQYLECAHDIYLHESAFDKKHILMFKNDNGLMNQAYDDNILEIVVECIRKLERDHEN
ncbi:hypothetical protein QBD00_001079 [Ochrobactrum sp. AN78]|nr:hypothetical protein [Ochrobactrum sp. AN78]